MTAAAARPPVNAHIHLPPNFSAFETVAQAVDVASTEGLAALGASNYYDFQVYEEFGRLAHRAGIFPIFGLEIIVLDPELQQAGVKINDPGNPGKLYLCGKGTGRVDPISPEAARLLDVIRESDSRRMAAMTESLRRLFAGAGMETGLEESAIRRGLAQRHGCTVETVFLQERHLAEAFQQALFSRLPPGARGPFLERLLGVPASRPDDAPAVQNDLRTHLMKAGRPAYEAERFVSFDHARELILALGGIPCYPVLADGARPICPFEAPVESLIQRLQSRDLHCAEWIPNRNRAELLAEWVPAMRRAGIVLTAGTEHNTRDAAPLAPACLGGQPLPRHAAEIFLEGARVVAAHQERVARGEPGYVADNGRLNPQFGSTEERIRAFAEEGSALIPDDPVT